jgi:hypothetical protein
MQRQRRELRAKREREIFIYFSVKRSFAIERRFIDLAHAPFSLERKAQDLACIITWMGLSIFDYLRLTLGWSRSKPPKKKSLALMFVTKKSQDMLYISIHPSIQTIKYKQVKRRFLRSAAAAAAVITCAAYP